VTHLSSLKYLLLAALIQLVWGFTPSASRIVLDSLPVEIYSAFRYSVAGLIFLTYTLVRYKRLQLRLKDLPAVAVIGILAYALDSLGTLYGLKLGGVLNFSLASSLNAVITAVVAALVLKERFSRAVWLAAALSIGGGVLLAAGKYDLSNIQVAGGSLCLIWGAYVLEALGFVFSKRFKARMPLTEYLAVAQLSAAAFMWALSAAAGESPRAIADMPPAGLWSLAFVCLVSCCLCYFLLYWLLNFVEGHKLAFFDFFHTLSAAAFGAMLFDEVVNAEMLLGGALLAGAVVLISWRHVRHGSDDKTGLLAS